MLSRIRRRFTHPGLWALLILPALIGAALLSAGLAASAYAPEPARIFVDPAAAPAAPAAPLTSALFHYRTNALALAQATPAAPAVRGPGQVTELILIKIVRGGPAAPGDWTLYATGTLTNPTNLAGSSPVDSAAQWAEFLPDAYTLSETFTGSDPAVGAAYTPEPWMCVDNQTGLPVGVSAGGTVVIVAGADVTCTIVNVYAPTPTPSPSPSPSPSPTAPPPWIIGRKVYVACDGPYQGATVGLSGWTITATLVGVETAQAVTTTDALGQYTFTAEMLGGMAFPGATIEVCEEDRPGWRHLTPACMIVAFPSPLPPGYSATVPDFVNAQVRR